MNSIHTDVNNNGKIVDSDNSLDSDNDDDDDDETDAKVDPVGNFTLKDKVQVVEGKKFFLSLLLQRASEIASTYKDVWEERENKFDESDFNFKSTNDRLERWRGTNKFWWFNLNLPPLISIESVFIYR